MGEGVLGEEMRCCGRSGGVGGGEGVLREERRCWGEERRCWGRRGQAEARRRDRNMTYGTWKGCAVGEAVRGQ